MASTLQKFLIAQVAYSFVYNLAFFVLFCRKIMKLDKLGQNLKVTVPRTISLKFGILIGMMILYSLHIILAYSAPGYWLSGYPDFSLISLLFIVNFTMQLYIVIKEVRKCQSRYMRNVIFWIVCLITEIIQIVVVEVKTIISQMLLPSPNATTIVQILLCLGEVSLILITLLFQKNINQSNSQFVQKLFGKNEDSSQSPPQTSIQRKERIIPTSKLYIDFNRQFQVIQSKDKICCQFKIAVYVDETANVITKSDADFDTLSHEMTKLFPNCRQVVLPVQNIKFQNMMKFGEQKQRTFQNYLHELTKNDRFYTPYLLQFLQIPSVIRSKLINSDKFNYIKRQTGISDQQQKFKVPFFKVTAQKNHIIVSNPDILQLIVNKKRDEILQFHHRLIEEKRLNIQMLSDPPQIQDVVNFIELVVNKKSLWRSFAVWLGLGSQLQNKIYNYFDVWNIGFKSISMEIIGHEISFDKEGKIHTLYLLSIGKKNGKINIQNEVRTIKNEGTILKKRYNDFFNLNKHIHRFFDKNSIDSHNLPDLPPKFSPFGSKTSPKSRQMRFNDYIKQLIKIEGINHCIKFLQFLQVDNTSNSSIIYDLQVQKNNQWIEHSERSYFSDLNQKHEL